MNNRKKSTDKEIFLMKNLTEGNIYKNFLIFAIPIILSGFLSQAYNIIDTVIAGKYLGEGGLAAVGATSALITFVTSVFWGYNTGASIYTAILFGAGKPKELKTCIYSNAAIIILISAVLSLTAIIFKNPIFKLLNIDGEIRASASVYYVVYISGLISFALNHFGVCTAQALGMSEFPLRMSIISTVINISGNLLSVAVFDFGVAGIAVSSVLAALVPCLGYFVRLEKCFKELGVSDCKIKINPVSIRKSMGFALPVMLQQSIMYTASLIISPIVNALGSGAIAAYSVDLKIYDINAGVYQNSAKSLMNYTAQCVGGGKIDKLKKGVFVGFVQGICLLLPCLLVCVCLSSQFCEIFFPKGYTGESLEMSIKFVRYFLPFVVFNVINNLFHAFFRGIKAMNFLLLFTALGAVSRVAATLFFSRNYGMDGVYMGWVASWMCEAVPVCILYFSGVWKMRLAKEIGY